MVGWWCCSNSFSCCGSCCCCSRCYCCLQPVVQRSYVQPGRHLICLSGRWMTSLDTSLTQTLLSLRTQTSSANTSVVFRSLMTLLFKRMATGSKMFLQSFSIFPFLENSWRPNWVLKDSKLDVRGSSKFLNISCSKSSSPWCDHFFV